MSKLNSLTGGYKGGSERNTSPESTPPPRNPVSEMISEVKEYYVDNNVTYNDLSFLMEGIRCLEDNIIFTHTHTPTTSGQRFMDFIEYKYEVKTFKLDDLGELIISLENIQTNITPKDKIPKNLPKDKPKSDFNLKTLSSYREGSPRIKSDNQYKPTKGAPPKQIDPTYIVDSLKTFKSGGNLTEDSIKKIISELNKLVK
tara:strand:+ start:437 stop:1036 length:600 start_codon:yes stop_codon:yes gene_type:complete